MTNWVRIEYDGAAGFGRLAADQCSVGVCQGDMFGQWVSTGEVLAVSAVRLLPPARPSIIIGLWNNFHELARKLGSTVPSEPLWFLKAPGSLIGPGQRILQPHGDAGRIAYEGELAIVVGRTCRNLTPAEAEAAIFGYTVFNDVTAIDLLKADATFDQWARAKSCDTFSAVGPNIATDFDWRVGRVRTLINGRERQNYPLADMIFDPPTILSKISREIALRPGDLIACGTSLGSLPMRAGTLVEIEIEGIGTLQNRFEVSGGEEPE